MKPQTTAILHALQRGETLTQLDALTRYGVARLAARVGEIRAAGYEVRAVPCRVRKQTGGAATVKRYSLGAEN